VLQQEAENACQGIIVKPEIFGKVLTSVWWSEDLKVALKCMGNTQNICCRDHKNITHI
jgi:hypothetical protein